MRANEVKVSQVIGVTTQPPRSVEFLYETSLKRYLKNINMFSNFFLISVALALYMVPSCCHAVEKAILIEALF